MSKNKEEVEKIQKKYKNIILIFVVLFVISAGLNFLTIFYRTYPYKDSETDDKEKIKYSLLNPARKFYDPKNLIINVQPLREDLDKKYGASPDISAYFEYLPTGASIALNKEADFYPASLLKVPVAIAVAKKIENGDWKWNNKLVLMSADKDDKFGSLYKEPTGSVFTIEELVRRSLVDSDNTAHFILVRNLETEEIGGVYDHMGLKGFLTTEGKLSAKKYSVIFRTLYNSSYLIEDNSQKLLNFLSQSEFKHYIQIALPKDIVFAHKIGIDQSKKVFLDSGIIYIKDRPYILTIMIKGDDEKTAKEKMKDISENVYTYIKNYNEEGN